ncbi:MAG: Hsp20/alpha crystallin family protein [Pseudomonadales bacterium]|nr:Hsp20/alpha crystallin family protein [Pseudomonadales bacterium]
MTLVPYESWLDFDRAFDHFFSPARQASEGRPGYLSPKVDIHEHDAYYEINAELPGLKKDDVAVNLHDGVLSIEAKTSEEKTEEKEGKVIRKERHSGHYLRRFNLGTDIKDDAISATFKDGLLSIKVQKPAPDTPQPKRIDIN